MPVHAAQHPREALPLPARSRAPGDRPQVDPRACAPADREDARAELSPRRGFPPLLLLLSVQEANELAGRLGDFYDCRLCKNSQIAVGSRAIIDVQKGGR